MAETDNPSPATSAEVRAHLARALDMDLIGPPAGHALAEERIPGRVRPSNWYLTGFLVPADAPPEQTADADEEEELDETPAASGLAEESAADRRPARRSFFPSSIGVSFLVAAEVDALDVTARWGDYALAEVEDDEGNKTPVWERQPNEATLRLRTDDEGPHAVPNSNGLAIHVRARAIDTDKLPEMPAGTRERIYAEETLGGERYGILLYTGTLDAEGPLGGLVQQGRRIEDHLEDALRDAALCSNDPICAQHVPDENAASLESRPLHGAACHGCSLIAETSCEMRNDFLDRALVVPVLSVEDAAFFELPV